MISEDKIKEINSLAKIDEVIGEFQSINTHGRSHYTDCPKCKKTGKGKGLSITPVKNISKCFSCGEGYNCTTYLQKAQNKNYPDALKWLAEYYNVQLDEYKRIPKKKNVKSTYMYKQLRESGLTRDDVKAIIPKDEKTSIEKPVFESATRNQYGQIVDGDDMIIHYYDLEGNPVTYQRKNSQKNHSLFRIRWQFPDQHLDKNDNPIKYQSPGGSGSHLYIPQVIRSIYQENRTIETLFIQEGEKKAEKACKHGIPSVGIMGIQNLVYNAKMPEEFNQLIIRCNIKEVVFILDNDWDQLSNKLEDGKSVDLRPRNFFSAVKKYKEFFRTFQNQSIYLEIYFGYINSNEANDKGIDDLLTNTLKGQEHSLKDDIKTAKVAAECKGEFVSLHKITTMPDGQLYKIWSLDSAKSFAEKYKDQLNDLREFKIGKHKWRFSETGEFESAQPLQNDEIFWDKEERTNSRGEKTISYHFDNHNAYNFLRNRGFFRMKITADQSARIEDRRNFCFVHIENKVVKTVDSYYIKDYCMELAKEILPKEEFKKIINMLYRGGKMYFGPDSLSNISYIDPAFENSNKDFQLLFFKDKYWHITANNISEKSLSKIDNHVWHSKVNNLDVSITKPLIEMYRVTEQDAKKDPVFKNYVGQFECNITELGHKCHYLKFIFNTGNFFWNNDEELSLEEELEISLHMANKMSAIGYLLHQYFDASIPKAVIGMDGKNSEIGSSHGGSGKSLFGDAIGQVIPQVGIAGKNKKLTEDPFIFEEVQESTDNVFIDDTRTNIDFEHFFPAITGKFTVNKKGVGKFTIPKIQTPKFYFSTNHAINGEGSSFTRRQFFISFSDFYNDAHTPIDDFNGIRLFDDWDKVQYNLFYNFCAACIQLYLKYGLVEGPKERLEQRRLRQTIGDNFIDWADSYFAYDEATQEFAPGRIADKHERKDLYDLCLTYTKVPTKFLTANIFKRKFKSYCKYRNAFFNPHKKHKDKITPGADDKSGGIEYFTISEKKYE